MIAMKKSEFVNKFRAIDSNKLKYDLIMVSVGNSDMVGCEMILFGRGDFDYKFAYYDKAYGVALDNGDEVMLLKANSNIMIIDIGGFASGQNIKFNANK